MRARFILKSSPVRNIERVTSAVRDVLGESGGIFEIKAAGDRIETSELAQDAVRKGYDIVAACGGDGTINDVAGALVHSQTALGVIPLGSGNGFARSLSIPEDIEGAVSLFKAFMRRRIDAGLISGRYFFSTAGLGLDARVSLRYNSNALSSRLRGVAPYYPIAAFEYLSYKPEPVTISADEFTLTVKPLLIAAANTERYGGEAVIAPGAVPDDGLLDLCIIESSTLIDALKLGKMLTKGNINAHSRFRSFRVKRAVIAGPGTHLLHADGEPFTADGDVTVEAVPGAISVIVP